MGKITTLWSISGVHITGEHLMLIFFWKTQGEVEGLSIQGPFSVHSFHLEIYHSVYREVQSPILVLYSARVYTLQRWYGLQMCLKARRKKLRFDLEAIYLQLILKFLKKPFIFLTTISIHSHLPPDTSETLVIQMYLDISYK